MQSAVVLLDRLKVTPKRQWREHSFPRTLTPVPISNVITGAWKLGRSEAAEHGAIVISLDAGGTPKSAAPILPIGDSQKVVIGVFQISFLMSDRVKVVLRQEECARHLASPGHRTRPIALLRPWKPVRFLFNGRSASYSGQFYLLREYYLALCTDPVPETLVPAKLVDLQVDLF